MRKSSRLLLAGLLAAATTVAVAGQIHAHDSSVPTGSAADCWKPAFLAGDADAVAACYVDDAVMIFPNGPLVHGRAAIRDGYAGFLAEMTIKDAQLVELGRSGNGDHVTTWGTFTVTMVPKAGGAEIVERGRYTELSRLVDGEWRYVVDHASDDPPPMAPEAPAAAGSH
jgi:uncharacterized protein (TIGR02246 family)